MDGDRARIFKLERFAKAVAENNKQLHSDIDDLTIAVEQLKSWSNSMIMGLYVINMILICGIILGIYIIK